MAFRLKNNAYQQRSGINYSSPAKVGLTEKDKEQIGIQTNNKNDLNESFAPYTSLAAKNAALAKEKLKKGKEGKEEKKETPKKDPYAEALKKDSKLGDYVKARKGLKKDSPEYAKLQNKINAAYGNKKRYNEGAKADVKKATVTGAKDDNIKTRGKNQNASKINDSEKKSNKDVAKSEKAIKVKEAKTELKTVKTDNKKEVKDLKKSNKVEKIDAKAEVASAKGKNKRADRLKAKAERKRTGKTKKEQGRNIFGGKTKKQKAKEAAAATVETVAKKKTAKYN